MHNRVIHFEIHANDPAKAAEFYRTVFGWEVRKANNLDIEYWIVMTAPDGSTEPGIDGGIVKREGGPAPRCEPTTSCTILVPDIDEYVKKIHAAGGRNVVPKAAVPGVGWVAYCTDNDGTVFGLLQSDKNAK